MTKEEYWARINEIRALKGRAAQQRMVALKTEANTTLTAIREDIAELETAENEIAAEEETGGQVELIDTEDPQAVALRFLEKNHRHSDAVTLIYWQETFYKWAGPRWETVPENELKSSVFQWLNLQWRRDRRNIVRVKADRSLVGEAMDALRNLTIRSAITPTGWDGNAPVEDPRTLISCQNGILDTNTLKLHSHTPLCFNTASAAASWDKAWSNAKFGHQAAIEKSLFAKFMTDLLGEDDEQKRCLQQVAGYLLTDRTDLQKAFMMIGQKRSGKGTFNNLMEKLNHGQTCTLQSRSADGTFALQNAIDKKICIMPDMRLDPKRTNFSALTEMILQISGEDPQSVPRKFREDWNGILRIRFWIMANSTPNLRDEDGVLSSRFIMFHTVGSFYGKEDTSLLKNLIDEMDIILLWAVLGLKDLNEAGRFSQSEKQLEMSKRTQAKMAPINAFAEEFLEITGNVNDTIICDHMATVFRYWAMTDVMMPGWTSNGFYKSMARVEDWSISRGQITDLITQKGDDPDETTKKIRRRVYRGVKWKDGKQPTQSQLSEWKHIMDTEDFSEVNENPVEE